MTVLEQNLTEHAKIKLRKMNAVTNRLSTKQVSKNKLKKIQCTVQILPSMKHILLYVCSTCTLHIAQIIKRTV